MFSRSDHEYMALAIRLAAKGMYTTDPNPRVGCVLVRDAKVIGKGFHERTGQAHAEVNAIADTGGEARGATAYVSLEPCSHHGRTPPCAEALVTAGVSRVVCAMQDPNPEVAGSGIKLLEAAGINVETGLLEAQAMALNPGFVSRMNQQRPYVRCKLGMSLDARTAMANGESQWITGPEAREDVHCLRARSSAILTGMGTVSADDPSLTCRLENDHERENKAEQPLRVILDTQGKISPQAKLLAQSGNTLIFTRDKQVLAALESDSVSICEVPTDSQGLSLQAVMQELARREMNEVLLEAGKTLSGAMLQAGLVDELVIYMAPVLMGDDARGLVHLPAVQHLADNIPLRISDMRAVGNDWRITAHPEKRT